MTPGKVRAVTVVQKAAQVQGMLRGIERLPLSDLAAFEVDPRNRLVHFYDEVSDQELYEICTQHAGDVRDLLEALLGWVRQHPELVEGRL